MPDTVIILFNLDTDSRNKTNSIAKNVDRALVKKVLMLGSKDFDTINNRDIHDNYKDDIYLNENKREKNLSYTYSTNILKTWIGEKRGIS